MDFAIFVLFLLSIVSVCIGLASALVQWLSDKSNNQAPYHTRNTKTERK